MHIGAVLADPGIPSRSDDWHSATLDDCFMDWLRIVGAITCQALKRLILGQLLQQVGQY